MNHQIPFTKSLVRRRPAKRSSQALLGDITSLFPRRYTNKTQPRFYWTRIKKYAPYAPLLALPSILLLLYLSLSIAGCAMWCEPGGISARVDILRNHFPRHVGFLDDMTKKSFRNSKAKEYWMKRKNEFAEAARSFPLHPYFVHGQFREKMSWMESIKARLLGFTIKLHATGEDGFKIEKDKCIMYEFFQLNNLPICDILGMWYDVKKAMSFFEYISAKKLPVFIKACHLTQGSSQGTMFIESFRDVSEVSGWIKSKSQQFPDDYDRIWAREGNELTDTLSPGFLVQKPMEQKGYNLKVDGRYTIGILEFRVEVFFGKPYLALFDGIFIFLPTGEIEDYSTISSWLSHAPSDGSARFAWIRDGNYMQCVWDLAAKTATLMHIDAVRVDIFLDRSNPSGCKLNEISLSSGMPYAGHEEFMSEVWKQPFLDGTIKTMKTKVPVYKQTVPPSTERPKEKPPASSAVALVADQKQQTNL